MQWPAARDVGAAPGRGGLRSVWFSIVIAAFVACGDSGPRDRPPPPSEPDNVRRPAIDAGVTAPVAFDPGPDVSDPPRPTGRAARDRKPIQLLLRSTPGGALAAVDGVAIGTTPVLWEGDVDGRARDFTFRMSGYALARYRFVPITGGIVHGTLARIPDEIPTPELPAAPPAPPPRLVPKPATVSATETAADITADTSATTDAAPPAPPPSTPPP